MGGPKALLPLGDATFLAHACRLFARPGVASVVAVLGAEAERVRVEAGLPAEATVVVNDRWREGMLSTVWAGSTRPRPRPPTPCSCTRWTIPWSQPATIDGVIAALSAGAAIAVPSPGAAAATRRGSPGRSGPRSAPPRRPAGRGPSSRGSRPRRPRPRGPTTAWWTSTGPRPTSSRPHRATPGRADGRGGVCSRSGGCTTGVRATYPAPRAALAFRSPPGPRLCPGPRPPDGLGEAAEQLRLSRDLADDARLRPLGGGPEPRRWSASCATGPDALTAVRRRVRARPSSRVSVAFYRTRRRRPASRDLRAASSASACAGCRPRCSSRCPSPSPG